MDWFDLLTFASQRFDELGVRYFVTGSGATITYGEARFTQDIDFVVALEQRHVEGICTSFPAPDFYVSDIAVREAIRLRRMIIHSSSGLKIDVSIPSGDEFDQLRMTRIVRLPRSDGSQICFSSPEDVIVKKMQWYRDGGSEKHLRDIAGVLSICSRPIDRAYIEKWAGHFGVLDTWNLILQRVDAGKSMRRFKVSPSGSACRTVATAEFL